MSSNTEQSPNSFDSLALSRGRSTRAASLAIPNGTIIDLLDEDQPSARNRFNLSPPSASSINIRRHSSHHCQIIDKVSDEQKRLQTLPVLPPAAVQTPSKPAVCVTDENDSLNVATPPPVPKRSFQKYGDTPTSGGRIHSNPFSPLLMGDSPVASPVLRPRRKRGETSSAVQMDSASVFVAPTAASSNRSSSDSNKSIHTNDSSGYATTSTIEADHIVFFGDSPDAFRTRFSSVDTQSSLDSCSDLIKCPSPTSSSDQNGERLPPVPKRRNQTAAGAFPKIPPPAAQKSNRKRGAAIPPVPPARSQTSLDSPRILQNGNATRFFPNGGAQEMHSKPLSKPCSNRSKFSQQSRALTQRQDSNLSSDSYSVTSSPGYNSKTMEVPLLLHAARINKVPAATKAASPSNGRGGGASNRQDSIISSDSFSLTSSPGYNTKLIETPLIAHTDKLHTNKYATRNTPFITVSRETATGRTFLECPHGMITPPENSPITKSASTPASLQTTVQFQNGSHLSLHRVINRRKSSSPLIAHPKLNCRSLQVIVNIVMVLLVLFSIGYVIYNGSETSSRDEERMRQMRLDHLADIKPYEHVPLEVHDQNPAPGVCLPVIVKFCSSAAYNYTVFPNYIGHFGQLDAEQELEAYEALVDVQCYDEIALFLCSIFAPKCGSTGQAVPPCKSLCMETTRRCGFFFDIFGLGLPDYLNCNILHDSTDPDVCVGYMEVQKARTREIYPSCSGYSCDVKRCIPTDWRCDGHTDCRDQADESACVACAEGEIYCGEKRCMSQAHVCDGIVHCPYGQDERNCVRLSDRSGDVGKGMLEVFKPLQKKWVPACIGLWDVYTSPKEVCTLLGYSSVNSTQLSVRFSGEMVSPTNDPTNQWRITQKHRNLLKEFNNCTEDQNYRVLNITCGNYECGKIRTHRLGERRPRKRIVGGKVSSPGDWPFIAAILGGPEQIFYCAGVLIADQWVLTAAHCVGNHTLRNLNDWTIQLGITRRQSHSYYGEKVNIQRVVPHPDYNAEVTHDNDIALFQLANRVAFHEHILPVCLPPPHMKVVEAGTMCTVIGWGKKDMQKGSAAYEPNINEAIVPVVNRSMCNTWMDHLNVTSGMVCAGYREGGKDACQGDSGGPLLCRDPNDKERWFVGGIVSWGVKCAHPQLPGVYANVPQYVPWILQQMQRFNNDNEEEHQHHEYGIRRDFDSGYRGHR